MDDKDENDDEREEARSGRGRLAFMLLPLGVVEAPHRGGTDGDVE